MGKILVINGADFSNVALDTVEIVEPGRREVFYASAESLWSDAPSSTPVSTSLFGVLAEKTARIVGIYGIFHQSGTIKVAAQELGTTKGTFTGSCDVTVTASETAVEYTLDTPIQITQGVQIGVVPNVAGMLKYKDAAGDKTSYTNGAVDGRRMFQFAFVLSVPYS